MPGLRDMKQAKNVDPEDLEDDEEHAGKKRFVVRFRNYTPRDENLKAYVLEKPRVYSIAKEIAEKLERIAVEDPDLTVLTIAPKKANWDLKRDLEPKLRKLEARTQRALIEMMREKLKAESEQRQRQQRQAAAAGDEAEQDDDDEMNRNVSLAIAETLADEEVEEADED